VGPDLTSIGASSQPDYLVESLIHPNARVKEGYLSIQIGTKDGRVVSGTIIRESAKLIELRTYTDEIISIPLTDISTRAEIGSLMPAGLVDNLLPDELRDLVKFMSVLGKAPLYDASRSGVARLWSFYMVSSGNQALGVQRVVAGDPTLADWKPMTALVNGAITGTTIRELYPVLVDSIAMSRGLYASVRFLAPQEERHVPFSLDGEVRAAWLNGIPIDVASSFSVDAADGVNVLVFQIAENALPHTLRLQSSGVTFLAD
jgi:putative heme-binding domain-containing protein